MAADHHSGNTREEQVIAAARATGRETGLEGRALLQPGSGSGSTPATRSDTASSGDGAGDRRRRRPTVDEGAVAEFALAIGHSTDSGRRRPGTWSSHVHRLPRTKEPGPGRWRWKARRIALPPCRCRPRCAAAVDKALYFVAPAVPVCGDRPAGGEGPRARPAETERRRGRGSGEAAREGPPGAMTYDGWS